MNRQLTAFNQQAKDQFVLRTRSEGYEMDFYGEVKPFADEVLKVVDEWKDLVSDWMTSEQPKYIYLKQIEDTYDNLTIVSVTSFQKDTRRKRFLNTISSIGYVLETIEQQLNVNI
nr:YppE family protein [Pullulanibacillus pueri]